MTAAYRPHTDWAREDLEAGHKSFAMGDTVQIDPGFYHGALRPTFATIRGEGAQPDTFKVIHGGWHMTFHASELTNVTGLGHGAEAAGYAL